MQKKSLAENGKDIKHSKTPTELFALYDKYIKSREVATEDVYYFLIKTSFFVKTGQIKFSVAQFLKKRAEIAETIDKVILADHDFWQENSEKKCAVLISALVNLKIDNALIEEKILNIVDNLAESSFPGLLHLINEYLPKNNQNNKNNTLILLKDRAIKKLKENKKDSGADVFLPALLFLINNNYYDRKFLSEGELKKRIQKMSAAEFNSLTKVIFFNKTAQPYFFIDSLWQYIEDNFNKMPQDLFLNSAYNILRVVHFLKIKLPKTKWLPLFKLDEQQFIEAKRFPAEELVYFAKMMSALGIDNKDFFLKIKNFLYYCPKKFKITEKVILLEAFYKKGLFVEEIAVDLEEEFIANMDGLKMRSLATLASVYFSGLAYDGIAEVILSEKKKFASIFKAIIKRMLVLIEQPKNSWEMPINIRDVTVVLNTCYRTGAFEQQELWPLALYFMRESKKANVRDIGYILNIYTMAASKQYEEVFTVFLSELHEKKADFLKNYSFNKDAYFRNIHDLLNGYTYIEKKYFVESDLKKLDEIFDFFRDNILHKKLKMASEKDRLAHLGDYLRYGREADKFFCDDLFEVVIKNRDIERYDIVDIAGFCEVLMLTGNTDFQLYQTVKTKLLSLKAPLSAINTIKILRYLLTIPEKDVELLMLLREQIKSLKQLPSEYTATWLIYDLAMFRERDNDICKMIADKMLALVHEGQKLNFSYQLMIGWSLVILKFYHKEYFSFLKKLIEENLGLIGSAEAGKINAMYLEMKNLAQQDTQWRPFDLSHRALEKVWTCLWREEKENNNKRIPANSWQAEVIKLINDNINGCNFTEIFDRETSLVFVGDPQKKIVLEMDADTFSLNNINYLYGKKDIKRRILNSRGWEIIFLNKKKWKLGENEQGLTFVKEKLELFEKKRAAEKINY